VFHSGSELKGITPSNNKMTMEYKPIIMRADDFLKLLMPTRKPQDNPVSVISGMLSKSGAHLVDSSVIAEKRARIESATKETGSQRRFSFSNTRVVYNIVQTESIIIEYTKMRIWRIHKMRKFFRFFSGVIFGAITGSAIALLFAPESGSELREVIGIRYQTLRKQFVQAMLERRAELESEIENFKKL